MSNDLCKLEGWLIKKKGDYHKKNKFFHHDNMRWFKLQEVKGNDHSELALCYFKSQRDKEPRGWIYVKDVSQIVDTETSFTVVSPARTMTIEATTPVELSTWLRAMVESCPHADTSRVYSSSVRYGSHRNNPPASQNGGNSKEDEFDYDEYRPLDKDSLLKLDSSARDKGDAGTSGKSLDRSISLFSRNADGDKNSFYYASSGQTQHLASGEHNKSGTFSSDDDFHSNGHNPRILGEGELMDELGGMSQSNPKRDKNSGTNGSTSRNGVADPVHREGREDHRLAGRNMATGGYGGGDSSTSNRLHRHIARDTPPRAGAHLSNHNNNGGRHHRNMSNQSHTPNNTSGHSSEEDPDHSGGTGTGAENSPFRASQATDEGGAFDSASSLYVHRDSPHNAGAGAGGIRPFPHVASSFETGHNSPSRMHHQTDAQLEVTSLATSQHEHDRIAHSRARLREKHRKNHQRNQGRGAPAGSDSDSNDADFKSDGGASGDSSSSSGEDYERSQRLASNTSQTRRRNMSRDSADEGSGRHSGTASPALRGVPGNTGGGSGAGSGRVPAPLGAPPRRARDAMLAEAASEGNAGVSNSHSSRVSLDDVLKRRRGDADDAADAKETSPRSGGERTRGSSSNGRTTAEDSDDDTEFDFKSERRHYNSRDTDFDSSAAATGASTTSTGAVGGSRPPRPPGGIKPPSGSSNIYSASAAAVIAGKSLPISTVSAGVGSGSSHSSSSSGASISGSGTGNTTGGNGSGNNFTFSQASLHQSSGSGSGAHNPRRGTSTPPRQAGDPGAKVDSNFVEEDWDVEENEPVTLSQHPPHSKDKNHNHHSSNSGNNDYYAESKQDRTHHHNNNSSSGSRGASRDLKDIDFDDDNVPVSSSSARSKNYPSTVRADLNWLDENFDEA